MKRKLMTYAKVCEILDKTQCKLLLGNGFSIVGLMMIIVFLSLAYWIVQ